MSPRNAYTIPGTHTPHSPHVLRSLCSAPADRVGMSDPLFLALVVLAAVVLCGGAAALLRAALRPSRGGAPPSPKADSTAGHTDRAPSAPGLRKRAPQREDVPAEAEGHAMPHPIEGDSEDDAESQAPKTCVVVRRRAQVLCVSLCLARQVPSSLHTPPPHLSGLAMWVQVGKHSPQMCTTLCGWQICHQTHVLWGCTTFGIESN